MESREQNVCECKECIKKLKKKLEENGFNILVVNDDILIKTPKKLSVKLLSYNSDSATAVGLPKQKCPVNGGGYIDHTNCTCTYMGNNCGVDKHNCPICNGTINNSGNSSNSSNNNTDTSNSNSISLFRIRPTDIYNGIFLHAVTLYGEECDLKMTFGYDLKAINQILSVLNFLA